MSLQNPNIDSNLAYLEVVSNNKDVFKNSEMNDIVFYCTPKQRILIGPYNNGDASLLSLNESILNINGRVKSTISMDTDTLNANLIDVKNISVETLFSSNSVSKDIHSSNIYADYLVGTKSVIQESFMKNCISSNLTTKEAYIDENFATNSYLSNINFQNCKGSNLQMSNISASNVNFDKMKSFNSICSNIFSLNSDLPNLTSQKAKIDNLNITGFLSFHGV